MAALSDADWLALCAAAKRGKLAPDADARAAIEACFAEYPAFAYDTKRVEAAIKRGERMLKLCAELATLYGEAADDILRERDLYYIERLRRRALALVAPCRASRRAHKGHHNVQREMLISRLCGIWLYNFNAERLGFSRPSKKGGGPPSGPLIEFLLAATRLVMPKPPKREALGDAIEREREERERARPWPALRQRAHGVSTLGK